jgi:phosphate transport system protein
MRRFDEELEDLQKRLLEMGGYVEMAIHSAISALMDRDEPRAREVLRNEARINRMQIEIDDDAVRLLALHQPMASDLRFLTVAIKINNDLERMGDLAVNIGERAISVSQRPPVNPDIDIPQISNLVLSMVRNSLDAFVKRDGQLARSVLVADDEVDDLRDAIAEELSCFMERDPRNIRTSIDLLTVTRNLERLADHATNIAEDVVFLVQGIDVRHHAEA